MIWFALCSCTCMLVCFPGGVCALVCSVLLYMYIGLFPRGSVYLVCSVLLCMYVGLFPRGSVCFGLLCIPVHVCWFVSQGECVLWFALCSCMCMLVCFPGGMCALVCSVLLYMYIGLFPRGSVYLVCSVLLCMYVGWFPRGSVCFGLLCIPVHVCWFVSQGECVLWFALCSCTCMLVCFPGGVCALVCSVLLYMYVGLFSRGSVYVGLLCAPVHVCWFVSQGECVLWFALYSCACMLVCFPGGVCALVCSVLLYMYVGLFPRGSVCFGLLCAPVHVCWFVSQGECVLWFVLCSCTCTLVCFLGGVCALVCSVLLYMYVCLFPRGVCIWFAL